jgi:hypothetical protein
MDILDGKEVGTLFYASDKKVKVSDK